MGTECDSDLTQQQYHISREWGGFSKHLQRSLSMLTETWQSTDYVATMVITLWERCSSGDHSTSAFCTVADLFGAGHELWENLWSEQKPTCNNYFSATESMTDWRHKKLYYQSVSSLLKTVVFTLWWKFQTHKFLFFQMEHKYILTHINMKNNFPTLWLRFGNYVQSSILFALVVKYILLSSQSLWHT